MAHSGTAIIGKSACEDLVEMDQEMRILANAAIQGKAWTFLNPTPPAHIPPRARARPALALR